MATLLQRCQSGEAEAIRELVESHQQAVYRLALSILDDPAEADEATQDTFVAALGDCIRSAARLPSPPGWQVSLSTCAATA